MKINLQYRALREIQELGIREGIVPPKCFVEERGLLYYTTWLVLMSPLIIPLTTYFVYSL